MPEYLAPGVYVEETSFRQKTIEGVSTSTSGFVGACRFGPVEGEPPLITNLSDFERYFHGLDELAFGGEAEPHPNFLAQSVRAFFEEGGRRLYIARAFRAYTADPTVTVPGGEHADGRARATLSDPANLSPATSDRIDLIARHPGSGGNITVRFIGRIGDNVLSSQPLGADLTGPAENVLRGVRPFDLVGISGPVSPGAPDTSPPGEIGEFYWADRYFDSTLNRETWRFWPESGGARRLDSLDPARNQVRVVTLAVEILFHGAPPRNEVQRTSVWEDLAFHPDHPRAVQTAFAPDLASREQQMSIPLVVQPSGNLPGPQVAQILLGQPRPDADRARVLGRLGVADTSPPRDLSVLALLDEERLGPAERVFEVRLSGGNDGLRPLAADFEGRGDQDPANASGLRAFEFVEDISIVAAPGHTYRYTGAYRANADQIVRLLISHCERMRYRVAVLDAPDGAGLSEIRAFRAAIDSTHAALYYPWIEILDPASIGGDPLRIPPSGAMAGIFARNDVDRGVHKAPANEVIRTAIGLEQLLNKAHQDVLNPEGINCLRSFEGRGFRVWGARTISSDLEWKYLNVRRYFAYLERSIERSTQWAVFEPNGPRLWRNVRLAVEDFLFSEWQNNRLFGLKPSEAFFVRCDRSTMSQNDIDNGRLVCLIGVAPLRPAEFVIFRIGQWTADRRN